MDARNLKNMGEDHMADKQAGIIDNTPLHSASMLVRQYKRS
ncbi:MAG: hypothetical protein ACYC2U_01065 [Candidatus Amoebophilus sp.]